MMNCQEITPDYLAEIRQADTHPDGIANRIGVTTWEMAAMPSDEYLATVRHYPKLMNSTLYGCDQ